MEMLVSTEAKDVLCRQLGENHAFILASRTEENQELRDKGCCAKGSYFQIVPIYGKSQKTRNFKSLFLLRIKLT